jgi:hypothetical protein
MVRRGGRGGGHLGKMWRLIRSVPAPSGLAKFCHPLKLFASHFSAGRAIFGPAISGSRLLLIAF